MGQPRHVAPAAFIGAFLVASCGGPAAPRQTQQKVALPPLELATLQGAPWSSSLQGRVQVIDIWASWCKPCRKGFALLNPMVQRNTNVRFTAISIDEDKKDVTRFLEQVNIGLEIVIDDGQKVTKPPLAVQRVPTLFVIDRNGFVVQRYEEPSVDDYAALEKLLATLTAP